jgi:beta-1,4-mannosyl-glycoprotein beta-1,4-N-acetylglucosaminyltransferase
MKIYDCFTFFNELDVLELRLMTLWDTVDYFVLCEATVNYRGAKKELVFEKNKARYEKYMSKIIYLLCDDLNEKAAHEPDEYKQLWIRENHQRNWVAKGYANAQPNDIVLISDLDEIPNPDVIRAHAPKLTNDKGAVFLLNNYWYFLNYQQVEPGTHYSFWKRLWYKIKKGEIYQPESPYYQIPCTIMARKSYAKVPQEMRNKVAGRRTTEYYLNHAGWHFSYMGGIDAIKFKIKSFAHSEHDIEKIINDDYIRNQIKAGNSLFNDVDKFKRIADLSTLPKPIQEHPEKFAHLLMLEQWS